MNLFDNDGADFSPCGKYRYLLWRIWDVSKPMVMFIGLNPSTANQTKDDPTIRRVKAFARLWGYGGVYMANCFPLVSPYPKDLELYLSKGGEVTSEENMRRLKAVGSECKLVVFAWGNFDVVARNGKHREMEAVFPEAVVLGFNKNGSPKHPLYVPSSVELQKFFI